MAMLYVLKPHPQGLHLSKTTTRSGKGHLATVKYYQLSADIAMELGLRFKITFPDVYERCKDAFAAGVWFEDDPGPWLGRAIVYKLPSRMHKDAKDGSPAAIFPCGYYTGGHCVLPQLGAVYKSVANFLCGMHVLIHF